MTFRRAGDWIGCSDTGYHYRLVEGVIWQRRRLYEEDRYLLLSELPEALQMFLQTGG